MKQELHDMLEKFLSTQSKSDGGWAAVSYEDMENLYDIFHKIIEMKYEVDADGDVPVQVKLVDRTKFQKLPYLPLPLMGGYPKSAEEFQDALRYASSNLSMAQHDLLWVTQNIDEVMNRTKKEKE